MKLSASILTSVAILGGAYLAADTVAAIVVAAVPQPERTRPARARKKPPPATPSPEELDRFAGVHGFGAGNGGEAASLPACPVPLEVLSAVEVEDRPELAIAAVRLSGELAVVQRGDVVADAPVEGVRIDDRGFAEVLLRGENGRLVACRARERESDIASAEVTRGPRGATVSRALVDAVVRGDRTDVWAGIRVVPFHRGGVVEGFRLFGVRPDSYAHAVGLRDRDVVRAVNGVRLDGPSAVFAAWSAHRGATEFTLEIERERKVETLRVAVR